MKDINFPQRNLTVHFVDPTSSFEPGINIIRQQFRQAITRILKLYNMRELACVVFSAHPSETIPTIGIGAFASDTHIIFIYIDPSFARFPKSLKNELVSTIAHETAHVIRMRSGQIVKNLFDAFVNEGLADHFAVEICGPKTKLWHKGYYSKLDIPYQLAQKESKNQITDSSYEKWFTVGDLKHNIPWTTGYALGNQIVSEYLKDNPGVSPSHLLGKNSNDFLSSFNKILTFKNK